MKHALLITAYKNFEQLRLLVEFFDGDFNIYIHIDKKSIPATDLIETIAKKYNVKYIGRDYTINWGGFNHLRSYLKLSEIALRDDENVFFHLISGQDFPVKPLASFKHFFEVNKSDIRDYIEFNKMPNPNWTNGGMSRIEYYQFYDIFNYKLKVERQILKFLLFSQKKIRIKRHINGFFGQLYGGSTYWSLSRETLLYVFSFVNNNSDFYKRFRYTYCAEEIFFQSIIMNSYRKNNVTNDNLRHIDWSSGRGGYPAILDETDYEALISGPNYFARKLDIKANQLLDKLIQHLS